MKRALQEVAVGLCVVVVVCAGMAWYTMAPEIRAAANSRAEARGWQPVFVEPEPEVALSWSTEVVPDMAKCPLTSGVYGGRVTMSMKVTNRTPPGAGTGLMRPAELLRAVAGEPWASLLYHSETMDAWRYWVRVGFGPDGAMNWQEQYIDIPKPGADEEATYSWTWVWHFEGACLDVVTAEQPIGEKGATHSKEIKVTETWSVPEGAEVRSVLTGDLGVDLDYTQPATFVSMSMALGLVTNQIDFWDDNGYVVQFTDLAFSGESIDVSTYTERLIGAHDEAYVEGIDDGFRFWCEPGSLLGPEMSWSEEMNAPYSYDFSNVRIRWMDGTEVPDELELYVTGMRTLSVGGVDIGPWHGTYAALKALGRITQQHGCYSWDTWDPDMQARVEAYLDLTSAESLGIEVRGSRPEYRADGAGFAEVPPDPSPVDGPYAAAAFHNGEVAYMNAHGYWLYLYDPGGPDWAIGPGPPADPYYIQDGGGPAGSYLPNTDSYASEYLGDGPAVSVSGDEIITVDSDCATPSFAHDATLIWDLWPLSATTRTEEPYMQDVAALAADANKGVYADAHTHTDWQGTNSTNPDSNGDFTVSAPGGSIKLDLASNYIARQAAVGGVGAIPVPTAYLVRRHDVLLGDGDPEEVEEAVWDWRGYYLQQGFRDLVLPCDVTCRVTYHDDLAGSSDNHKTDSTRQTEYSYDPGPEYTLERTIHVTYADGLGWSPILVDLYDEQNGHPLALVKSIEWALPAGSYRLDEPMLVADPGDRQELLPGSPGYREAPSGLGMALKVDESWRYAQGVVSATINGYCDRVWFAPDHAKGCTVERCMDTLNVLIGASTGQDLTTNYSLATWPVTNAGERLTYTHSQAAEDAHMVDEDDERLAVLAVRDIAPQMALADTAGSMILPVAVRAYSIECVRGLPYTFYGTKYVGGRANGVGVDRARHDFPRARGRVVGTLYHRHLGSADPWQGVEGSIPTDEHGRWVSQAWGISDTDAARTLWEYALRADNMGRWATREYAMIEGYVSLAGEPDLAEDLPGRAVVVWVEGGDVWCARIETLTAVPDAPVMVVDADDASAPAVELLDDGLLVVTWMDGGATYMRHSTDGGRTWLDVV